MPCSDDNVCTTGDFCLGGVYMASSSTTATPCFDGNPRTLNDQCAAGECVGGSPMECDDYNPCTSDSCGPLPGCLSFSNSACAPARVPALSVRSAVFLWCLLIAPSLLILLRRKSSSRARIGLCIGILSLVVGGTAGDYAFRAEPTSAALCGVETELAVR